MADPATVRSKLCVTANGNTGSLNPVKMSPKPAVRVKSPPNRYWAGERRISLPCKRTEPEVAVREAAPPTWKVVPVVAPAPSNWMSPVPAVTVNAPVISVSPNKFADVPAITKADPAVRFRLMKSVPAEANSDPPMVESPRSTSVPAKMLAPPVTDS